MIFHDVVTNHPWIRSDAGWADYQVELASLGLRFEEETGLPYRVPTGRAGPASHKFTDAFMEWSGPKIAEWAAKENR